MVRGPRRSAAGSTPPCGAQLTRCQVLLLLLLLVVVVVV
jgi:hypothetical protein